MALFYTTIQQMFILFIFICIGYICNKKMFLAPNTDESLAKLENNILMPALILNTFISQCTIKTLSQKWEIFIWGILILAGTLVVSHLLAKIFREDAYTENIFRYSFAFPNIGFMGIAVIQGIGGADLLFDYMIFTLPYNLFIYSIGVTWLLPGNGSQKFQLKKLINPMFTAMAIGTILGLLAPPIPQVVMGSISSLSACMSPLAMILTGYVIAKFNVLELLKNKKVYIASILRLIAIPLLTYSVLIVLNVSHNIILPAICALAMPMGLNTIVIPIAHKLDVTLGASMALISSVAAVITIPIVFMLIL